MLGQIFIYFIRVGNYFLSVQNGNVVESTTPSPLKFSPSGWQEVSIMTERNKTYRAFDRTFTIPLEFVEDGAKIYRYLITKYGYKVIINQIIAERQIEYDTTVTPVPTFKVWYDLLYSGEADIPSFEMQRPKFTVNFVEGGPGKYIKKNENVNYEIPINETEYLNDGINLIGKQTIGIVDGVDYKGGFTEGDGGYFFFIAASLLSVEGTSTGLAFFPSPFEAFQVQPQDYDWKQSVSYFLTADEYNATSIDAHLVGKMGIRLKVKRRIHNFRVRALVVSDTSFNYNTLRQYTLFINSTTAEGPYILENEGDTVIVDINTTIPLIKGERVFLFADFTTVGPERFSDFDFLPDSAFSINYVNKYDTTETPALKIGTAWERLVSMATDNKYTGRSDYLTSISDKKLLTSGQGIRNLSEPVLTESIVSFFRGANGLRPMGMGIIDNIVRLEPAEFWLTASNTVQLIDTGIPKYYPASDYFFNRLLLGYEVTDLEDVNGLNDFSNTFEYSVDGPAQADLEVISPWIASCYAQEYLRINLDGKDTTDNPGDKKTYIVDVLPQVVGPYILDRTLNPFTTGLLAGTQSSVYNIGLRPKAMFEAHEWYFHSCFYKQDGDFFRFRTAEKNKELVVNGIADKEDKLLGDFAPAKFLPWLVDIETVVPVGYKPLSTDAYGFIDQGAQFVGVSEKSAMQPYTNKAQVFTLLALPNNNFEALI